MTQEDRKLLLTDLCARLQYEVKVDHFGTVKELLGIMPSSENVMVGYDINDYEDSIIEDIKPYLRPMSSMTEEERKEYNDIVKNTIDFYNCPKSEEICFFIIPIEWLNKHHFDYRGLIEKGLALEAPEGMYNIKEQ